ncbi:hypothetical protein AMECASPLE_019863 [Ameca splendens]|uniref:Uncharacterized protein n=1 Tax=Ameca splendens TaxID=208324 RepID=A0ABV0YE76_9TELE
MACTCIALYQLPRDPKNTLHYSQSSTHSSTHLHTNSCELLYIAATAAMGQTDSSEAAIQSAPPGPVITISRQVGRSVLAKDTDTDRTGVQTSSPPVTGRTPTT